MAVYLKGCPLSCKWCHSPESRRPEPELILVRDRCARCGACVSACARGVHYVSDSAHVIGREQCVACGDCVEQCAHGALAIKGYRVSANAVIAKAARLKAFFDHSGGGVTLTGGEVTSQPEFAAAVLAGCRKRGIHTAVETSGACVWDALQRIAAHADLVLYDLKLADDDAHQRWTGVSNEQILANAAQLAQAARNVQVRVPLIPGITDTDGNLRDIFTFVREVGLASVAILPYNPSAAAKYEWLDLAYEIEGEPQSVERVAELVEMARRAGLDAVIG